MATTTLGNVFFDKLSLYFKQVDSYKDIDGKGLFERFLAIFGDDIDGILLPLLEDITSIINPAQSEDLLNYLMGLDPNNGKFLNHIAYTLNNPPDIVDEGTFRKLLTYVLSLYKIRGTKRAIRYWGYLLGLDLQVVEIDSPVIKADSGYKYDSELITSEVSKEIPKYDSNCTTCSNYYIVVEGTIKT